MCEVFGYDIPAPEMTARWFDKYRTGSGSDRVVARLEILGGSASTNKVD